MPRRGTYTPQHQTQRNPADPYGRYNCAAYALAMWIDRATMGGVWLHGRAVRAMTNEPKPEPDSPGLTMDQLEAVAHRFVLAAWRADRLTVDVLRQWVEEGRGAVVFGLYGALPRQYRASTTFVGPHAVYANHTDSRLGLSVSDPLQTRRIYWPWSVVEAYLSPNGPRQAMFTRRTPYVWVP